MEFWFLLFTPEPWFLIKWWLWTGKSCWNVRAMIMAMHASRVKFREHGCQNILDNWMPNSMKVLFQSSLHIRQIPDIWKCSQMLDLDICLLPVPDKFSKSIQWNPLIPVCSNFICSSWTWKCLLTQIQIFAWPGDWNVTFLSEAETLMGCWSSTMLLWSLLMTIILSPPWRMLTS